MIPQEMFARDVRGARDVRDAVRKPYVAPGGAQTAFSGERMERHNVKEKDQKSELSPYSHTEHHTKHEKNSL